ncbi:transglycosylase SLT domain-containing protein [Aquibacillus sediminis]|uniref:transglycosylase SLT domain-containing protein n=1 Tax=Aquibacillus sediminis TaxID=2574734 RepID=UPI001FE634B4|nr:transglycosylase SLT domain-containing protein [Aquibacillus sediminis]
MSKVSNFVFVFILFFIGLSIFAIIQLKQQQALQTENDQLQQENERLQAQTEYMEMETDEEKDAENGYQNWQTLEQVANDLVEASEGKFKKTWALYLARESQKLNVDPYIAFELLKVETGGDFDPNLIGPETPYGRAHGMAQFMKNTAPWIADMAGLPYDDELLYDPYYSIHLSLVYLDFLFGQYQNWDEVLTAYNRGMDGLENYKQLNGHAESTYAITIQENADSYESVVMNEVRISNVN